MHATDAAMLEPRLRRAESKGCIRIPATLDVFIDRHGLLDAEYEQAHAAGRSKWILRPARIVVPWPGRYLVIIDSGTTQRPPWSALPGARRPAVSATAALSMRSAPAMMRADRLAC